MKVGGTVVAEPRGNYGHDMIIRARTTAKSPTCNDKAGRKSKSRNRWHNLEYIFYDERDRKLSF